MTIREIVASIFDSYAYNRSINHMIELCAEIKGRLDGDYKAEWTEDGNIIYGFLICLYGDYGTSPRSGWVSAEYKKKIISYINDIIRRYNQCI